MDQGSSILEEKAFYNLSVQKPQISVPMPHLKFTHLPEIPEPKSKDDRNECAKTTTEYVYETRRSTIRIRGSVVNIENKSPLADVNSFEFCNVFSFEGGGCLKLITNDPKLYHR